MKNYQRGFTLIELLAVTIILIVISLIALTVTNRHIEKNKLSAFISDTNTYKKAAAEKFSTERKTSSSLDDLFHNSVSGKVCYSIDALTGKYVEKLNSTYKGSVEVCYGIDCEYSTKIWITDGNNYIDGLTNIEDTNLITDHFSTNYPYTCGVESIGGGGDSGDLLTSEFSYTGKESVMFISKDGVYSLEVWGAQGGNALENRGGYGAYSYTEVELHRGDNLYINVGGKGGDYNQETLQNGTGGYNGGSGCETSDGISGGGGGATSIAIKSGLIGDPIAPDYIYIVAGGGGGAYKRGSSANLIGYNAGGISDESTYIHQYETSKSNYGKTLAGNSAGGYYGAKGSTSCTERGYGGSGFISNPLTRNGVMYGFNVAESSNASTKTISTTNVSKKPVATYAKQDDGYAIIKYIGNYSS